MKARHAVKTLRLPDGERLPVLIDRSTGCPAFYPNLYILTELRQVSAATATLVRGLREIMVLLDYLAASRICLADRIGEGRLLTIGEVDGLARHCRQSFAKWTSAVSATTSRGSNVSRFLLGRAPKSARAPHEVLSPTAANRIRTIHAYLSWLVRLRISHDDLADSTKNSLAQVVDEVLSTLWARIPPSKGRNTLGQRRGATQETVRSLVEAIGPGSSKNPWSNGFVRRRNFLIVCWLWKLGLRRGELLNIRISDVDFRTNTVIIARRADDPDDPRRDQPRVKTRDRKLEVSSDLIAATHQYIIHERSRIPNARKNSYLFVSKEGAPLSLSSLNKIFRTLRANCSELPEDFSAHVLRHTWNDSFSRVADEKGIPESREEQLRSYLMGWSPTSSTARTYTRRHVQERARQVSLSMQQKMMLSGQDD